MSKYTSVDEYLSAVQPESARRTLERIRAILREELPNAQEVISYGIPTYKQNGMIISFAAFKNHCSLFPGHTVQQFAAQLQDFKVSKGTIQFPHDSPPSEFLVREMARTRLNENLSAGC